MVFSELDELVDYLTNNDIVTPEEAESDIDWALELMKSWLRERGDGLSNTPTELLELLVDYDFLCEDEETGVLEILCSPEDWIEAREILLEEDF